MIPLILSGPEAALECLSHPEVGSSELCSGSPGGAAGVRERATRALMLPRSVPLLFRTAAPLQADLSALGEFMTLPCNDILDIEIKFFASVSDYKINKRSENKSTAATTVLVMLTVVTITLVKIKEDG